MGKRGRLVRLIDNSGYEDVPIGAIGVVLNWVDAAGKPRRGGLYVVEFPTEHLGRVRTRTMFVDRFETVGEVEHE